MKIKTLIISVCLAAVFCFNVSAATVSLSESGITITVPAQFTAVENTRQSISSNSDFIGTLGHSADSIATYMNDAGILLLAATADNTRQIQVKSWDTTFSKEIGSLAFFSDDDDSLNAAVEALVGENDGETVKNISRIAKADGTLYIKIEKLVSAAQDFSYVQYVTIIDGSYYSLVYYNFGGEFTESQLSEADSIFNSMSIPIKNTINLEDGNNVLNIVLLWAAIVIVSIFAVIIIISLFRDAKRNREESGTGEKIKRRKF